jgi:hypothetical protein
MTFMKTISFLAIAGLLSACEGGGGRVKTDKTQDYGFRSHHLSTMTAGIWVDPNGCDHWIIDDGVEGYMSERLDPYGKPVCSDAAPPNTVIGPFQGTSTIGDLL